MGPVGHFLHSPSKRQAQVCSWDHSGTCLLRTYPISERYDTQQNQMQQKAASQKIQDEMTDYLRQLQLIWRACKQSENE
jgi:hypothetical protein